MSAASRTLTSAPWLPAVICQLIFLFPLPALASPRIPARAKSPATTTFNFVGTLSNWKDLKPTSSNLAQQAKLSFNLPDGAQSQMLYVCLRRCGPLPRAPKNLKSLLGQELAVDYTRFGKKKFLYAIKSLSPGASPSPTPTASASPSPTPKALSPVSLSFTQPSKILYPDPLNLSVTYTDPDKRITQLSVVVDELGEQAALLASSIRVEGLVPGKHAISLKATLSDKSIVYSKQHLVDVLPAPILLPVEILGAEPTSSQQLVYLSPSLYRILPQTLTFRAQIFALDYQNKAAIEINDDFSLTLNNASVGMTERQRAFEGIGGAYSTLKIFFSIPKSALKEGDNYIRFKFLGTDGTSIGFRVLRFNIEYGKESLIPEAAFVYDDPATWTPPIPSAEAIAEGKSLWSSKELRSSSLPTATKLRARCADCHIDDGYDLKFFNYSNHAIIERAKFHGMTEDEGKKIASYIRSLDAPNPGRPWDPPYQPGPGLDSKPTAYWAAGAGVDWVLDDDTQSLPYIFPNGIPSEIDLSKNLNHREIPIALELPVWNHWLPRIHPLDYFGDNFDNHGVTNAVRPYTCYLSVLNDKRLAQGGRAGFEAFNNWNGCSGYIFAHGFVSPGIYSRLMPPEDQYSPRDSTAKYSLFQWSIVKGWGLMRRNDLEGQARIAQAEGYSYFNPSSAAKEIPERHWHYAQIFRVAPHILHLPSTGHGIRNGSGLMWNYFTAAWYELQMILDSDVRHGDGSTHWPYMLAFAGLSSGKSYGGSTTIIGLIKAMEAYYNNLLPSAGPASAWQGFFYNHLMGNVSAATVARFNGIPPDQLIKITEMLQRTYLKRTQFFSKEQLQSGTNYVSTPVTTLSTNADGVLYFNQRYYAVLRALVRTNMGGLTIDKTLTNEMVDYGKYLWPEIATEFEALRRP